MNASKTHVPLLSMALAVALWPAAMRGGPPAAETYWRLDNLRAIGGHPVTLIGSPEVVTTEIGTAIEFDGRQDGLLLDVNPIAGFGAFTIEVVLQPAADGPEEQRFLHIQESGSEDRALIELRRGADSSWTLDTYLRDGPSGVTLIEPERRHPAARWAAVALVYDGKTMSHFVDGRLEASAPMRLVPLGAGQVSIGVRQNRVSWFKGRIASIRVTSDALPAARLLRVPSAADARMANPRQSANQNVAWARGIEGQRQADLGNGFYLNPILSGDHPDPSVLKDGADYYMTFSSFDAYPGLVIWHSRDLMNWRPRGATLTQNVGSVWAPDLVKHGGRYYIYFPARTASTRTNYVIWADDIDGPWSQPIDLKITQIDPGHAVDADGQRWLFVSGGFMAPLAADGLSVTGAMRKVYDGWKYPDEWIVESFSQEGPKILKHGGYYHMILAQGGTAGPPTGHMIVSARARALTGPWENSPYNPIVRTRSSAERWWSKGHGTLVEAPDGRWHLVYHAYENGFYTLGRQTLLEPVEWTADGWVRGTGADVDAPIRQPAPSAGAHGMALSDSFSTNKMGVQWSFYDGRAEDARYRYEEGSLVLRAIGTTPADSSPLWFVAGDHAYEIQVDVEADPRATAGVVVFYNRKLYAGLGVSPTHFILHRYGTERTQNKPAEIGRRFSLRLRNDRHVVTIHYSADGRTWQRFGTAMEVSGYHHNVAYDFLSLRPALYAAGHGEVRFRDFQYRALP